MSYLFFGIGFILFSIYLVLLVWNIIYNGRKQQEENYPTITADTIDMDGIGNQGRVPMLKKRKHVRKKFKQKVG